MSRLRLDLIVKRYFVPDDEAGVRRADRWTWRLWSGSRVVSTSGPQLYSRRIDCARGAEVGAGLRDVKEALDSLRAGFLGIAYRITVEQWEAVDVRLLDERAA